MKYSIVGFNNETGLPVSMLNSLSYPYPLSEGDQARTSLASAERLAASANKTANTYGDRTWKVVSDKEFAAAIAARNNAAAEKVVRESEGSYNSLHREQAANVSKVRNILSR